MTNANLVALNAENVAANESPQEVVEFKSFAEFYPLA